MSRILIVEDESHLAEGLAFNIEAEGHEVEIVGDGRSAVERVSGVRLRSDDVTAGVGATFVRRSGRRSWCHRD